MTILLESKPPASAPLLPEVELEEYFSIIFSLCENTNLTEVVRPYFGVGGYQVEHPCVKECQQHSELHKEECCQQVER